MTTPTPAAPSAAESALLKALQAVLGAEHAAVYGFGVVGAKSAGAAQQKARTSYDAHRARRDEVEALIVKEGGRPQASAPAYTLPFPVESAADAARLAVHLEDGVAAHLADLVAAASGDGRIAAARWLQDTAFAGVAWRGSTVAFPGLPERAAPAATGTGAPAGSSGQPS
ncbi:ferritin-like domain-containing protein [Yinghuangia soli]|uniref:Ferritin-like domain-containing protein n=1 Tax=Yinghuangia soli TaxID=2908204 RepID=A0AA41Q3A3_9ACTN|nr:ferritin-like domain-containing protein [Yinghuangia soli]MCF2530531.1 ferritin-like domain-containing protein [Yinghuangia soli]